MPDYRNRAANGETAAMVRRLRLGGTSINETARMLGIHRMTVIYHLRREGLIRGRARKAQRLYRCPVCHGASPYPVGHPECVEL